MNHSLIVQALLENVSLNEKDLTRLVLEALDYLGEGARNKTRAELLQWLHGVIRHGVPAMEQASHTVSLQEAAWASLHARQHLRPVTQRDLRFYIRRIVSLESYAHRPLNSFTVSHCRALLECLFGACSSDYIKGRSVLHSIFAFGMRAEWCPRNPVALISPPHRREKNIRPLSPAEVNRLKRTAERPDFRDMKLSLSLLLYCGIRPTEISRLQAGDFNWAENAVIIRSTTSKTGGGRVVPMRCTRGIAKEERCIPRNWQRRWKALRHAAGFRSWIPDICRHTFASYHAAYFKDLSALQLEMGHRDTMLLRTRYVSPARRKDAVTFWKEAQFRAT